MTIKLLKKESEQPGWLKQYTNVPIVYKDISEMNPPEIKKPSAGFIKFVKAQVSSPELVGIHLKSETEQERYKLHIAKRRHTFSSEELEQGREALRRGRFGVDYVEEKGAPKEHELTKKQKFMQSDKYKTPRQLRRMGLSSIEKKLPIKESYIRTELSKNIVPIKDPVFGITLYQKQKLFAKPKIESVRNFIKDNFTLGGLKPSQKLIKPTEVKSIPKKPQKQSFIKELTDISKYSTKSLFSGIFTTPKPKPQKVEKPKQIRKKKPVERKFKIIKKYYRRYPKKCKR